MLKYHFDLIILLLAISNLGVEAQTTPELILPDEIQDVVKLNISIVKKQKISDDSLLAVFVRNETDEYVSNAIQGQYTRDGNYLIFKPYFPFESGMVYIVRTINANSTYSYQRFQVGKKKRYGEAKVVGIYPTASQVPENLLRFYIYFNTPMKKGQVLKHIKLVDEQGNIDNHAFMEFKQELWSADSKRLTLLFDPGRIKRGVSTNIEKGSALLEEKRYKLSISGTWQDVYGQKLSENSTKEIEVTNAYRHHIKVNDWVLTKPKPNSYDTLVINFERIIDHALLQSMIKIVDTENNFISGYWEILENEQSIKFIPQKKWKEGGYRIIIDSRLEDVAGNNLQNLLDHINMDKENNNKTYHNIDFKI